jgi:hypothetical protein
VGEIIKHRLSQKQHEPTEKRGLSNQFRENKTKKPIAGVGDAIIKGSL